MITRLNEFCDKFNKNEYPLLKTIITVVCFVIGMLVYQMVLK